MSQHSIKILKDQSKWQRRKKIGLTLLIILGLLISCGLLYFYFFYDQRSKFDTDGNINSEYTSQQTDDNSKDIDLVIVTPNSEDKKPFDPILTPSNTVESQPVQNAQALSTSKQKVITKQDVQSKVQANKDVKITALSGKATPITKTPQITPKVKVNRPPTPYISAADDIDAIILLELDVAFKPIESNFRSSKTVSKH